jgi:hypothetical protein
MALNEAFAKNGWDLEHGGRGRDVCFGDLERCVEDIVRRKGYEGEVKSTIIAALSTRFESLSQAGKGAALCSSVSMEPKEFIAHPTVVELGEIGSEEDRAIVILMIILSIYEYLQTLGPTSKPRCAIVIEEAGALFGRVEGKGGAEYDSKEARRKMVEVVSRLAAEIRALGAIMIFVNQSAVSLPLEVTENTSTKIIHQVADDVDAGKVARMLGLNEEQKRALTSLEVGRPVIKTPLVSHPFQVEVNSVAMYGVDPTKFVSDEDLREYMKRTFYDDHPEYLTAETVKTTPPVKQAKTVRPPTDTGDTTALMVVASAGFGEKYAQAIRSCKGNNVKPLTDFLWSWAALSTEKGRRAVRFALNIFTEASVRYNAEVEAKAFWRLYRALEVELAERASSFRVGSETPSR